MHPRAILARADTRIAWGAVIAGCLSTAPSVAFDRWVTDDPWPYVYSVWGAALLGTALFVFDVAAPAVAQPLRRSTPLLIAMAVSMAFLAWVAASAWWSVSPAGTPPQAMVLVMVTLTAVWFGCGLTFRQQVWSLFIALHLLTSVSFLSALVLESARYPKDGSWMGVFGNPNTTGPVATLGMVAAIGVMSLKADRSVRVAIGLCIALDIVVAVRTLSITGWLALAGAVAAVVLVRMATRARRRRPIRVVVTTLVTAAVVSIPWSIEFAVSVVSNEATFSGRTLIWDFVRESVGDRWLLGFGWSSFWDEPSNLAPLLERAQRERPEWVDDLAAINSAHSSFMEALLLLGVIGLVLLLALVAFSVGRTWWQALGHPSPAMEWWAAVATFALVVNVTESMIAFNPLFWLLLVAPGFAAARHAG